MSKYVLSYFYRFTCEIEYQERLDVLHEILVTGSHDNEIFHKVNSQEIVVDFVYDTKEEFEEALGRLEEAFPSAEIFSYEIGD